jgi:hypothetical protein
MDYLSLSSNLENNLKMSKSNYCETENTFTSYKNYTDRETFQISNKFISKDEWETIIHLFEHSSNFHTLSIIGINIDSYGIKKISEIVATNNKIKTLKLEWNYLNEYIDEFNHLCQTISNNPQIIFLQLNNNKLNSIQAESISRILELNSKVLSIDLRWNEISNEGAKRILLALANNFSLQELNLSGNKISEEILLEINQLLIRNRSICNKSNLENENKFKKYPDSAFNSLEKKLKFETSFTNFSPRENFSELQNNLNSPINELANEYIAKYESLFLNSNNLENKLKETQSLLSNEKVRFDEYKERIKKDLQTERDIRAQYEEQFLKKNEEFTKREFDLKKNITDLEIKISFLTQEKIDILNEDALLKEQVKRIKESLEEKYKLLETQFSETVLFQQENFERLKVDYEKVKKESNNEIIRIKKEYEKKFKLFEEQNLTIKNEKDELEKIILNLRIENNEKKLVYETERKEKNTKQQEDEVNIFLTYF